MKAQVVGEHLSKLYKQHNKQLTKEHIVKDAAKQRSPIHACFEWDDKKAAHQHRLDAAGHMLTVVSIVQEHGDKKVTTRAFVNIQHTDTGQLHFSADGHRKGGSSFFVSILDVQEDPMMLKYTLEAALRDMEVFQNKYSELVELKGVFKEIKKARRRAA